MSQTSADRLKVLDDLLTDAVDRGLLQRTPDDLPLDGRLIAFEGRELVNFGSCSYLGLETDPRLKEAAVAATLRYGTQFSSSRSYISAPPYPALEGMLEELFGGSVMVAPSTSLGHLSTLPVVVADRDAVVLDQQVHHSVQLAANQLRVQGTRVEMVRHSRMDLLEERLAELTKTHDRVWYLADGIYSMFADAAPLDALAELMERYEQLHLYIDDSHGMSWSGLNGRGYVLGRMPIRERMIVAASLNKAFAAAGGAFVFPDADTRRRVQLLGGPMMFSGPIQPPMLGAALASAQIHLSPEIAERQAQLRERVQLCNTLLEEFELPLVAPSEAPIRYVGAGLPRIAYKVAERMIADGLYVNVAPFPAVPMKQGGIRTPITVHHTPADIHRLVESLDRNLRRTLAEEGSSIEEVERAFGLRRSAPAAAVPVAGASAPLRIERFGTIDELDAGEWDALMGDRGTFSAEGLRFLERAFRGGERPEDGWTFAYYIVRDAASRVVAATFTTEALWKDDMLAPAAVSARVEEMRESDPYLLTSRTLSLGSLLTEGDHLYLDRGGDWRAALALLLEAIGRQQDDCGADAVVLRDFADADRELGDYLRERGFVRVPMLDSLTLERDFETDDELLERLSPKARYHQRNEVLPWEGSFDVEVVAHGGRALDRAELEHLHALYLATQSRSLELNTFDLPLSAFEGMLDFPSWELVLLRLKPEAGGPADGRPVAFGAHFVGREHYAPLVVGLDYEYVRSHRSYRVALLTVLRRARAHGSRRVLLGMGASLEKRRFGAQPERRCAYFQAREHFNIELLAQIQADVGAAGALQAR